MMHFSIDSGYSRKNQRYDWNQHGAGSSSFKKNGVQRSDWKKKEHIVLQIMNIIKLQRKNATILIRMLHFYLHLLYRMAFMELNPKNKKFQISAYRSIFK